MPVYGEIIRDLRHGCNQNKHTICLALGAILDLSNNVPCTRGPAVHPPYLCLNFPRMQTLIKLGLLLLVGILAYNYFLGTPQEREQSQKIIGKARELGSEAWNLLRSERDKLDAGKYDGALDRLETLYTKLTERAEKLSDSEALEELRRLRAQRDALDERLSQEPTPSESSQRELEALTSDTEVLMHEMETKGRTAAPY